MYSRNASVRLIVLGLAVCLAGSSLAADKIPCDRRIPKTAVAFLSIRCPELAKKFKESHTGKLVMDPALDDFRSELVKQLEEHSSEVTDKLGLSFADLLEIPQGELGLALVTTKGKLAVVALLDFGESKESVLTLLEKAAGELEKHAKRTEEEYEGSELVTYTLEAEEDQEGNGQKRPARQNAGFNSLSWCLKDTQLILASSPETVKSVLRFWDGEQPGSLADNEVYEYISQKCRDENQDEPPVIAWYLNPMGAVQAGAAAAGPQALFATAALAPLGLDKLRGTGGAIDFVSGEFDYVSRTLVYVDLPANGVLDILTFPGAELAPPKWVSNDVVGYRTFNWDVEAAYDAVESTVDKFLGKGTTSKWLDDQAKNAETANLHYKKDIIDQLSGRFHFVQQSSEDPTNSPVLFAFQLKDPDAFERSLGKLTAHPGFPGERRQFQGTTIHDIPLSGDLKFGMAIAKQQFLLSSDVTLLEQVLRDNTGDSLADSPDYQAVSRHFPAETSLIGYAKTESQYRNILNYVKTTLQAQQTDLKIDLSKLPEFETIAKYFTPGGSYMINDQRGLFIVDFTLRNKTGE